MTEAELRNIFHESGSLKEGHFLLTSGLHSPQYFDKFRLLKQPMLAAPVCEEMAARWSDSGVDLVVGPAVGGIILSYEVARHLGVHGVFMERIEGKFTLRRGFSIEPQMKVLIVEDVITTGGSVMEVYEAVKQYGAEVVGIALLVDRSGGKVSFDVPVNALLTLDLETYEPDDCPLCAQGTELHAPGRTGKVEGSL